MKLLIVVLAVIYQITAQNEDFFSFLEGDIQKNNTDHMKCNGDGSGSWECYPGYLCNEDNIVKDSINVISKRFGVIDESIHYQCGDKDFLKCCKKSDDLTKNFKEKCPGDVSEGWECVQNYVCNDNNTIRDLSAVITPRFGLDCDGNDGLKCCKKADQSTTPPVREIYVGGGCGVRQKNGILYEKTKDNESRFGEFPWMMSIQDKKYKYLCGGSLIHPKIVLTYTNHVKGKNPNELIVRGGVWNSQVIDETYKHVNRDVIEIITHPDHNRRTGANNIALLVLKEEFKLDKHIQTICLPPDNYIIPDNLMCTVTGWGKDVYGKNGIYQNILKKINVPIVPKSKCQNALRQTVLGRNYLLHRTFLCAGGEEGQDACDGDGGSPLVCETGTYSGIYWQVGIVSWGVGCGDATIPGIYSNIIVLKKWINDQFANKDLSTKYYDYNH